MTTEATTQGLHTQEHPTVFKGFSEREAEQAWRALVKVAQAFKPRPEEVTESG